MSALALTPEESTELARYEAVIELGLTTFVAVADALRAIRNNMLYRETHRSFEAYCRDRWGFSDSRARQLMLAAETVTNVTVDGLPAPSSEGVARALPRNPEAARETWRATVEQHGDRPTARQVAETRVRLSGGDEQARDIVAQKLAQGEIETALDYAETMGVTIAERVIEDAVAVGGKLAVLFSSTRDEWATPQDFFDALDREFHFEVDVSASADNAKCPTFFTEETDGLSQPWNGVCWMNPPYSDVAHWIEKAHHSALAGATVVALIPARVETRAWWDYCRHHEVRFVRGRLKFGDSPNSAPFPSAVVVFGRPANVIWWEPEEVSSREDLAA